MILIRPLFQHSSSNFQAIFESIPGLYLVLKSNLNVVAVSDSYLQTITAKREDVLGRNIFDIPSHSISPHASSINNLSTSIERVLQGKLSDLLIGQKYYVRHLELTGEVLEERHWNLVNTPILDENNEIIYIIHSVEDVTGLIEDCVFS